MKLWNAVRVEDWDRTRDLNERLMPVWDADGMDNMRSLVRYAQELQGVPAGVARKPTSPATKEQR